jgi:hypothetical protein
LKLKQPVDRFKPADGFMPKNEVMEDFNRTHIYQAGNANGMCSNEAASTGGIGMLPVDA